MAEEKTYVFNDGQGSNRGMDLAYLLNGQNNGNGNGFGQDGIWAILLLALLGRNGFGGFGGGDAANGGGSIPTILNGDAGREMLMSAIQGNATAISQLATTLNCDISAVRTAIQGLEGSICQVGNQVGMSSLQVVNAIQSGNSSLANQIAQCCCATQNAITSQGYENQLATCNQTNTLVNTMNTNNQSVIARLDAMERASLLDKMDALCEKNSVLQNEISQRNQNEFIAASLVPINSRLAAMECRQLPTYPQAYMPGIPTTTFAAPMCGGAFAAGYAAGDNAAV